MLLRWTAAVLVLFAALALAFVAPATALPSLLRVDTGNVNTFFTSDGIDVYVECNNLTGSLQVGAPFSGNIMQLGYSNRTRRYYFTAGYSLYTSVLPLTQIETAADYYMVFTQNISINWDPYLAAPWISDIFLVNQYFVPSDPNTDHIAYTSRIPNSQNAIISLMVGPDGLGGYHAWTTAQNTTLLHSANSVSGYVVGTATAYDPSWNISWWFASNTPFQDYGLGIVSSTQIAWVNHKTGAVVEINHPDLGDLTALTSALVIPSMQSIYWVNDSAVYYTALANNPFSPIGFRFSLLGRIDTGSFFVTSLVYQESTNSLIVGCHSSIVLTVSLATLEITNVLLILHGNDLYSSYLSQAPNLVVSYMMIHPNHPNLIWVSLCNFQFCVFSKITATTSSPGEYLWMYAFKGAGSWLATYTYPGPYFAVDYTTDNLFMTIGNTIPLMPYIGVGFDHPLQYPSSLSGAQPDFVITSGTMSCVQVFQTHNCSLHDSCQTCQDDPNFCGWCPMSKVCTDSNTGCPSVQESWTSSYVCPISGYASPTAISSAGNVEIALVTSDVASNLSCVYTQSGYSSSTSFPTNISSSTVLCSSPPASAFAGTSTSVSLQIQHGSYEPWGEPFSLSYYNCSAFSDCNSCSTDSSGVCGWCVTSGRCSAAASCNDGSFTSSCPVLYGFTQSSISAQGGESISFLGDFIIPNGTYNLIFGNNGASASAVTRASSNSSLVLVASQAVNFTVTTPSLTISGTQTIPVTLKRSDGGVIASSNISVYNCPSYSPCSSCTSAGPRCTYCSSGCVDIAVASGSCTGSYGNCALVSNVSPASVFVGTSASLTLTSSNIPSGSLFCVFSNSSMSVQTAATPSSSSIACSSPTSLSVGFYSLTIGSPAAVTNTLIFEVYDCTSAPCDKCVSGRPACQWCNDFATPNIGCQTTGSSCSATLTSASSCPVLTSASPSQVQLSAASNLTLFGTLLHPSLATSGSCVFSVGASPISVEVLTANNTAVTCNTTMFTQAGISNASVHYSTTPYTEPVGIQVFSCTAFMSCTACQTIASCGWGADGCVSISSGIPYVANGTCPVLTSSYPSSALASSGDPINVNGGPFLPGTAVKCDFSGIRTNGLTTTSTAISCPAPTFIDSTPTNLTIWTSDGNTMFAPNTLTVNFVRCPGFTTSICSSVCAASPVPSTGEVLPGCGFCTKTGLCTTQSRCSSMWVPDCFDITTLTPPFLATNENFNVSITVKDAPVLPFGVSLASDAFACSFQGFPLITAALNVDPISNEATLTCAAPLYPTPKSFVLQFEYLSVPFTQPTAFQYQSCDKATDCTSCLLLSPCGWCLDTQTCTSPNFCPLGNYSTATTGCPHLSAITPTEGERKGGDTVTILGQLFIPSPDLVVLWDNTTVLTPVFINSTALQVVSPSHSKSGAVAVQVYFQNLTANTLSPYSDNSEPFSYLPTQISIVGLGVGLALGLLLLLAAVIIVGVICFRRRTKGALIFAIREPDYALVAFGANNDLAYRMPGDGYKSLEQTLARHAFSLQVTIAATSPPTEEDLLAKSMLYVAQAHGDSVGAINAMVRGEIRRCLEENTIFRNNSVASKSFKFYSRIVGIPYLWKCMARVIYELEVLGARSNKEKEKDASSSTSLLRMTMEVDMDRYEGPEGDVDTEVNALQLKLTCQKLFGVLVKNGVQDIPAEFRKIFVEIDQEIMKKFNSDMAVYKAIGGFFFLRFVCPAITAPHYYGLLEKPPNEVTQRQLVLISKVLQSLANMQMPGRKEAYMESMSDFIEKNMGSVVRFYQDMREASRVNIGAAAPMDVPDNARLNALAAIWDFLISSQAKVTADIEKNAPPEHRDALLADFQNLAMLYPNRPKKVKDEKEGGAKSSRKKSKE